MDGGGVSRALKIATIDTFAQLGAENAHLEALAVALKATAFAAIAAFVVLFTGVRPSDWTCVTSSSHFWLEGVGVSFEDCLNGGAFFLGEETVVATIPAVAVRAACELFGKTFAVKFEAAGVFAIASFCGLAARRWRLTGVGGLGSFKFGGAGRERRRGRGDRWCGGIGGGVAEAMERE